ncbi:uncharacterized protein LOC134786896 [Penaeus indicus]|uniref:uncharacterized protein LOC134786896 n=1 Tax=Penaeus indicus TaxID=29960 RepID=UPI00300C7122
MLLVLTLPLLVLEDSLMVLDITALLPLVESSLMLELQGAFPYGLQPHTPIDHLAGFPYGVGHHSPIAGFHSGLGPYAHSGRLNAAFGQNTSNAAFRSRTSASMSSGNKEAQNE